MYWRSLWFRGPAADPSARGIFYLAAIAHKKSDDNILSQQATAAALKRNVSAPRCNAGYEASAVRLPSARQAGLGYHLER